MGGGKQSIHTGNTAPMHYRNKKGLSQQLPTAIYMSKMELFFTEGVLTI
jgi:hypothetical protein